MRDDIVRLASAFPKQSNDLLELLNVRATPDFVPHELWPDKIWLLPLEPTPEPWYYFAQRTHPPSDIRNPNFLDSVDAPIRPLVKWMLDRGIQTGPSCAGHDISPGTFQAIWHGLLADAAKIRGPGLPMRDIENGDIYLMRDKRYRMPWEDFSKFFRKADRHRMIGYLPFSTDNPRAQDLVGQWPGYEITNPSEGEYRIKTKTPDPETWGTVGDHVRYSLGSLPDS